MGSCGSQEVSLTPRKEAIPPSSTIIENNIMILFYSDTPVSSYDTLLRLFPKSIISKMIRYYSPSLDKSVLFIDAMNPKTFKSDIGLLLEICKESVLIQISAIKVIKLLLPEDKEIERISNSNRPMKLKSFIEFMGTLNKIPTIREVSNHLKKTTS